MDSRKKVNELVEVMKDNPGLPVYFFTNFDQCLWPGKISKINLDYISQDENLVGKKKIEDHLCGDIEFSDGDAMKEYVDFIFNRMIKENEAEKAIIVFIDV